MSDYQRIVSYLYRYQNGKKGGNVGIVRVETRADGLRLFFHIKDEKMEDERYIKAYFYFHEDQKKKGIFVDRFPCFRGYCSYKNMIRDVDRFSDRDLNGFNGMVFYDENGLLYGTCWDEQEIIEGRIELMDSLKKQEFTEEKREALEKQQEVMEEKREAPERQQEVMEEKKELEEEKTEEIKCLESGICPEKLLDSREPFPVCRDEDRIKVVRITGEEASCLPRPYGEILREPFLQNALKQYGFLLLGKICSEKIPVPWILGVPGSSYHEELQEAADLGFTHYLPDRQKTGSGFWICFMDLKDL